MNAIYKGGGFLTGIPARDLSAAEWEALTDGQQQAAIDSNLYEILPDKKQKPAKKGSESGGE